jgi:hypothetical protein
MNSNHNIPTTIVDDFFDNPEHIRDYALSLEYTKDPEFKWPGKRSRQLYDINPNLFEFIINRALSLFYRPGIDYSQWKAKCSFQLVDKSYGTGWIHKDMETITGIIYLNKENNPNAGTTIYQRKSGHSLLNTDKKIQFFKGDIDLETATRYRKENDEQFEETVTIKNKFNRLVMFDSGLYHGANDFEDNNNQQDSDRLTLVFFIEKIDVYQHPIVRMKCT